MKTIQPVFKPVRIPNYQAMAPFSNFLPGVAGPWGVPVWVFYVNRGQGVCSFGFEDKDHALMEFWPANQAYAEVHRMGFRTFLRIRSGSTLVNYEPFQYPAKGVRQEMCIEPDRFSVSDTHPKSIYTRVEYFGLPNEPFGGLVRTMTLTNQGRKRVSLEVLDGVPFMVPFGIGENDLKKQRYISEAIIVAEWVKGNIPLFRIRLDNNDTPDVQEIKQSHFCICHEHVNGTDTIVRPFVDPALFFGAVSDFSIPVNFYSGKFRASMARKTETLENHFPCVFCHRSIQLNPGESWQMSYILGRAGSREEAESLAERTGKKNYLTIKAAENRSIIASIIRHNLTISGHEAFDQYSMQNFLDNSVRGGFPVSDGKRHFYMFHRKHGDLERDYNFFRISPAYLSQGAVHYRDANQNRRNDPWFVPGVGMENIVRFINLIQLDGFNPLVLQETQYRLPGPVAAHLTRKYRLSGDLTRPFLIGQVIMAAETGSGLDHVQRQDLFHEIMDQAIPDNRADHGEGFWSDHWTYNLDLIESYISLFPENLKSLLLEEKIFTYYDNAHFVVPRSRKYTVFDGKFIQLHSVQLDPHKAELIRARTEQPNAVRKHGGRGEVYYTTLLVKLVSLAAVKMASLDPSGIGIEMEADKPGWYDALNGLPGMLGSSSNETFELCRLAHFLLKSLDALSCADQDAFSLPAEIRALLDSLRPLVSADDKTTDATYHYWDNSTRLKEEFRAQIHEGLSGDEVSMAFGELRADLRQIMAKLERGLSRAYDKKQGVYTTYYYHQPKSWKPEDASAGNPIPRAFTCHALPLFLEGNVHAMRVLPDKSRVKELHERLKKTRLFDSALKMFKVNEPFGNVPYSVGRARGFTPGWLENESIWLHMEYKYLLELLRNGLHAEFWESAQDCLVPFLSLAKYGRSTFENSSFIASSAHPDKQRHGKGYYARLSGSTAEFIHMWLLMCLGPKPFYLDQSGQLELRFRPILPSWLFTKTAKLDGAIPKNSYAFLFLGKTLVVYLNPGKKDTFGPKAAQPGKIVLIDRSGRREEHKGGVVPAPKAEAVRSGAFDRIEVVFR